MRVLDCFIVCCFGVATAQVNWCPGWEDHVGDIFQTSIEKSCAFPDETYSCSEIGSLSLCDDAQIGDRAKRQCPVTCGTCPGATVVSESICFDTCATRVEDSFQPCDPPSAEPTLCDDGGAGSTSTQCPLGTDCTDCGLRTVERPTEQPSATPTRSPSAIPSRSPSQQPTPSPSVSPSRFPSLSPSDSPSRSPSLSPFAPSDPSSPVGEGPAAAGDGNLAAKAAGGAIAGLVVFALVMYVWCWAPFGKKGGPLLVSIMYSKVMEDEDVPRKLEAKLRKEFGKNVDVHLCTRKCSLRFSRTGSCFIIFLDSAALHDMDMGSKNTCAFRHATSAMKHKDAKTLIYAVDTEAMDFASWPPLGSLTNFLQDIQIDPVFHRKGHEEKLDTVLNDVGRILEFRIGTEDLSAKVQ